MVLTLHRVLPQEEYARTSSQDGIIVRDTTFEALTRYLSRHYDLLDLRHGPPQFSPGLPRLRVALTFDDGWKDSITTAFPITTRYNIPWVVFVCPALQGCRFPFWPERVMAQRRAFFGTANTEQYIEFLKALPADRREQELASQSYTSALPTDEPNNAAMTWEEMALLHRSGVALGSHTNTHQILTTLEPSAAQSELTSSKAALENSLQAPCTLFAYPNGNCTPAVRDLVKAAGYTIAFTTRPGAWTRECDPLLVPRLNVAEQKMIGWRGGFSRAAFEYNIFWKAARKSKTEG